MNSSERSNFENELTQVVTSIKKANNDRDGLRNTHLLRNRLKQVQIPPPFAY